LTEDARFERQAAGLLLAVAMVLTVLLVWAPGTGDVQTFLGWTTLAQEHGLVRGYRVMVDRWPETVLQPHSDAGGGEYPPLGFTWLYVVATMADLIGTSHFAMFKIAILVCSFASTLTLWLCCRSLPLAAAFQGATVLVATGLGYMDVVAAPFLIGSLWAIRDERPVWGITLFILGSLIKWQLLLVGPFLLPHVLQISHWRSVGRALSRPLFWQLIAVTAITSLMIGVVFGDSPLRAFLYALRHPFLSGDALNVPWIATLLAHVLYSRAFSIGDELPLAYASISVLLAFKLVFFTLLACILLRYLRVERSFANCLLFAVVGVVTYCVWSSAVHENHWFVALITAYLLAGFSGNGSARWICILVSVMLNVNLFVFEGITGQAVVRRNIGFDLSIVLAALYTGIWLILMRHAWAVQSVTSRVGQLTAKPTSS
jgi:hypothetical protein